MNSFLLIYLSSTFAPAASNLALISSASFLLTPDLTSFGAPSTRSLASFKPNEVESGVNKKEAEEIKAKLEAAGAKVELK